MATTTVAHASLIRYDNDGNQLVINLKNTGDDVSISRSSNGNLPSGANTAQGLANALGALAFKSSLSKSDVGLGNVNNTADSSKSVKYATSAGSAGSASQFSFTELSNTDIDTLRTEGKIYFAGGGNTCKNTPITNSAFELFVGRNASGYRYQRFITTDGEIYIRVYDSSHWGAWKKLAFTTDTVDVAKSANSVAWGNVTGKPSTFTPSSHTHTKSQITDFPSSLPASDVYAWAKAKSKPAYSKSEVGLGNVDNTADSAKSVKYATSAGSANAVAWGNVSGKPSTYPPASHTHNYAGSSSAGGPATSASSLVHGAIQCGDNKNTTGYRLMATVSLNAWSNYRAVLLVRSRHEGAGILSIGIGCNAATVSYDNAYAEIKYFGIVSSGSVINSSAYQIHISSDGKTAYLFELYQDYSPLYYVTLSSEFGINANGTWVTSISTTTYGKLKALTEINRASSVDWSGVQNKPSTYPSEDNLVVSKTTPSKACLWAKID
nr:MAG TPA: structural protein [Caudoviricetes sp.]